MLVKMLGIPTEPESGEVRLRTNKWQLARPHCKLVNPDKVRAILEAPESSSTKAMSRFLGQIWWHSRMIQHLADFATPLHTIVHRLPFQWAEAEEKAYEALKVMLSQAPIVQPPD